MSQPDAVVIGGGLSALSVVRSLGRRGIAVHVLSDARSDAPAGLSRYAASFADFSHLDDASTAWMEWLTTASPGSVLLPGSDEALELLAKHRDELVDLGLVPVEHSPDAVLAMLDKSATYQVAEAAGVPAPQHFVASSLEDLAAAQTFRFPCAIKPLHSHLFRHHFAHKLLVAHDMAELVAAFHRTSAVGAAVMVTELVTDAGDEYASYYTYLDDDGEPLLHFTKRKLRQWPVGCGIGSYHVTAWDSEVAELGLRFAQAAGLRGLVNVEFKHDGTDGSLRLIECNPRFTAANELVRRAGVDLAVLAYDRALRRPTVLPTTFVEGLHQWLPLRDLRALAGYRQAGQLTTAAWTRTLLHRQSLPILARDDLGPLIASVRATVVHVMSRSGRGTWPTSAYDRRRVRT